MNKKYLLTNSSKKNSLKHQIETNGQFFKLSNGDRFTAIEHSDFNLLNRYQHGENIRGVLEQRSTIGFNMLRVWTAYDIVNIGTFLDIDYSRIPSFVSLCADYGCYIEFTAYTGVNDPIHWESLIDASLNCQIKPILELVNELDQNTNEPDYLGRIFNLSDYQQAPASLLSCHGSNGSEHGPVGFIWIPKPTPEDPNAGEWFAEDVWSYATFHTNDASEWWRKVGHNAMELWSGPTLANENTRFDHDPNIIHAHDAAKGAALLCAGSDCHTQAGKQSILLTGDELAWAIEWVKGAKEVNLECQQGPYTRHPPGDLLRLYERPVSGHYCIVEIRK